jgi:hypothetical protein
VKRVLSFVPAWLIMVALQCMPISAQPRTQPLVRTLPADSVSTLGIEVSDSAAYAVVRSDLLTRPSSRERDVRSFWIDLGVGRILNTTITLEDVTRGQYSWSGRIRGVSSSKVVFIATSDSSFIGTVQVGDSIFQISQVRDSVHTIQKLQQSNFPEELPPDTPARTPAREGSEAVSDALELANCSPVNVDILVVYTSRANTDATTGNQPDIRDRAKLAVGQANAALRDSKIPHQFSLVGVVEVPYNFEGDIRRDLERLRVVGDGFLDEVHALRDQTKADIVSLWVSGASACGLGYLLRDLQPTHAFNVVRYDCATFPYSFTHEVGHNLGLDHDRNNSQPPGGIEPFSFGYQDPGGAFRTVEAYQRGCDGKCDRQLLFSTPQVSFLGKPAGVALVADNASSARKTMCVAARWR